MGCAALRRARGKAELSPFLRCGLSPDYVRIHPLRKLPILPSIPTDTRPVSVILEPLVRGLKESCSIDLSAIVQACVFHGSQTRILDQSPSFLGSSCSTVLSMPSIQATLDNGYHASSFDRLEATRPHDARYAGFCVTWTTPPTLAFSTALNP